MIGALRIFDLSGLQNSLILPNLSYSFPTLLRIADLLGLQKSLILPNLSYSFPTLLNSFVS